MGLLPHRADKEFGFRPAPLLLAVALCTAGLFTFVRPDALTISLSILSLFIATVVLGFASRHLRADPRRGRFALQVTLFAASLIGLACAPDLLTLAFCWITSGRILAALVGHVGDWRQAREAARRCRSAFLVGDAALVGACAILGWWCGSLSLKAVLGTSMPANLASTVGTLMLIAVVVRSALPPFSSWLLGSMAAPTPVSALMHGGFVNAGGFLLIRFAPVLMHAPAIQAAAVILGLIAATYGIFVLMIRPDIKGTLAGSTVSQMGFMVICCGVGAFGPALWHLIAHGLFKAWLFLGAGSTIGFRPERKRSTTRPGLVALAALAAGAATVVLGWSGLGPAALPLALAAITAVATALALGRSTPLNGLIALLALGASAAAGASLGEVTGEPQAAVATPILAALATAIAAVWAVQIAVATRGLPPRFYAFLLNSGVRAAR